MTLSGSTSAQTSTAKPFVKWVGGKRQLLPELEERLPQNIDVYFEPFLGGGALFFHLAHRISQAYLSDKNEELITAYKAIQMNPNLLIQELSKHKNTEEHFYQIRDVDRDSDYQWNWSPIQKAARFIYLNKTCFNGLYRVNAHGQFNAPFGNYTNPKIVDSENIYACNEVLCRPGVFLQTRSYVDVLNEIKSLVNLGRSVFVYLDPPYIPLSISSSFTQYSKDGFTMKDQEELKSFCDSLTSLNVKWMQSNSSAPIVFDMYKDYTIDTVSAKRSVSAILSGRNCVTETIIRNYAD
jgi:DNA adenine methylase